MNCFRHIEIEEDAILSIKPRSRIMLHCLDQNTFNKLVDTLEELTEKNYFTIQEPKNVSYKCLYCDEHWEKEHGEKHEYDCPVSVGRQLLEELK